MTVSWRFHHHPRSATHTPGPPPCPGDAISSGCHQPPQAKSIHGGKDVGTCRCSDIEVSQAQTGTRQSNRHKIEATQLLVAPGGVLELLAPHLGEPGWQHILPHARDTQS